MFFQKVERWLAPPVFPDDENKTRRAYLLNAVLINMATLMPVIFIGNLLGGRTPLPVIGANVLAFVLCLILRSWMQRGKVRLASISVMAMGLILITASAASLGTIRAPTTAMFMLLVISGGLLFDLRGMAITTALCSFMIAGLTVAGNAGLLPRPDYSVTITQWVAYTAIFAWTGGLTFSALRAMRQALARADQEIAEHKQAEVQIAYQSYLLENVHDAILATDDKFILNAWNHTAEEMYGWKTDEVIGRRVQEVLPSEFTDVQRGEALRSLAETGRFRAEVLQHRRDGQAIYVEGTTMALRSTDGYIAGYVSANRDITERKRAEGALREAYQLLETIFDHTHMMVAYLDPQFNFIRVNRAYAQADEREPAFFPGKNHFALFPNAENEAIFRRVVETGKPYFAFAKPFEYAEHLERGVSYWDWSLAPIKDRDGAVTALILTLLNVTDRLWAEQALRESEVKFRNIYAQSPLGIEIYDSDGRLVDANPACLALFGVSDLKAVMGFDLFSDLNVPEDAMVKLRNGEPVKYEAVFDFDLVRQGKLYETTKSGKCYLDCLITPLVSDMGAISGYLAQVRDITERKQGEAALAKAETLLRMVLSNAPITIFAIDDQGVFTLSEGKGLDRIGLKPGEHIGDSARDLYGSIPFFEYSGEVITGKEVIERALAGETVTVFDELNGVYFDNHIGPIRDADGKVVGAVGVATDITERRQAEKALRASEERLKCVLENSPDTIYTLDLTTSKAGFLNRGEFCGYSRQELESAGSILHAVDPSDLAVVKANWARVIAGRGAEPIEYRLQEKGGDMVWIAQRITVLARDAENKPSQLLVTLSDITEHKRMEEKLHTASLYTRSLIEASLDPLVTISPEGKITDVNKATELVTGASRQNIIGSDFSDYFTEPEKAREGYQQVFSQGLVRDYPLAIRHASGKTTDVLYNAAVYKNQAGEVQGVFAAARDITERKRAEEALKESETRYRTLFNTAKDAIFIMKGETFISCNNAAVQMFGCEDEKDMFEHTPWDFSPAAQPDGQDSKPKAVSLIKSALDGNSLYFYWQHSRKDGALFDAEVSLNGVMIQEKPFIQAIVRDITERKRAEEELTRSHEQLRALSQYLQLALEEERTAVAREIHDELGQALTALKIDLAWLTRHLPPEEKILWEKTESMSALTDTTIQTVRQIATELRPGLLDDLGLVAALEWQAGEFQKRTGIACELHLPEESPSLERDLSTAVFRIFQETLTNIARHAAATRVRVELNVSPQELILVVRDNGRGITESQASDLKSLGLIGMRERVQQWEGELTILGKRGHGTTVTVRVPLARPKEKKK